MLEVWFWQRIVTPHMMGLAVALSERMVRVTYVAEELMSIERKQQGWLEPEACGVRLVLADRQREVGALVAHASFDAIHVCQGVRANGLVGVAQNALEKRGLTYLVVLESAMDSGWRGVFKRFEYSRIFQKKQNSLAALLAIGYLTPEWLIRRGVSSSKVFPFAYFLDKGEPVEVVEDPVGPVRFIFVGQFIPVKRLDWLINALAELDCQEFELSVVGSGPLENAIREKASAVLGEKLNWVGRLPSDRVRGYIAAADCLVLPSIYDGWGAVVSEALLCGTPVICSAACGSAGIVRSSNFGGVFERDDFEGLKALLEKAAAAGRVAGEKRRQIIGWSDVITASAGAQYLIDIVSPDPTEANKISPPWSDRKQ